MRRITPFKTDSRGIDQSGYYIALSCGKRGIALNLKSDEGLKIAQRLALEWADVIVENFSPGVMKGFGLDYETLSAKKPELIYASLCGYGQTGPQSARRAYDICIQSESGLTIMNGEENRRPHRIGYSVTDYCAGRDIVIGILGSLRLRDATGKGQYVDVAMFDCGVSLTENAIPRYSLRGEIATAMGSRHPAASPHNLYKTSDGFVNIIVIDDRLWAKLTNAMEMPELVDDPDLAKARDRLKHVDRIDEIVEGWTSRHTTAEVVAKLQENELPYGVLNDMKAVIENEQTIAREMAPEIDQTALGKMRVNGCPIKLSATEAKVRGPAPLLGEHNKEVLCGILGYSDEDYGRLLKDGVVGTDEK
jgi:crotonobetainyl-CoA:carnitine CoA-transferase CaiB-like acyl-CoA transferase